MKKIPEYDKAIEDQDLSKIALKNSSYNLVSLLVLKLGGLIFTVLIARMLLPELFGVYSLALSIVTIFLSFSGLGVNNSFMRYSSEAFGKRKKSLFRGYFSFFFKLQSFLTFIIILVVLCFSRFIADTIYAKPYIYPILIFSCLYILMESFNNFLANIFTAIKDIKSLVFLSTLYQISKISFSLLAVVLLKSYFKVSGLFIAFAISAFIVLLFEILILFKRDKEIFYGKRERIDKKRTWNYFWFMSLASLSLVLFVSIDTLILGKFVDAEYLGYYRAALSLILTLSSLFLVSGVLLPIFTQIQKKRFERGFQKTIRALMIFAIPATAGILFIAKHLVFLIYGTEYLPATLPLYFLSFLVVTGPFINTYTLLLQSKERTKSVAYSTVAALILNIILNYVLITSLLKYGQGYALVGAGISTVLSRIFILGILSYDAKKNLNLRLKGVGVKKPVFATLIMSLFLLFYNKFVDINIIYGAIEVILGAGIYLGIMILIKGVNKEDLQLLKSIVKR